MAEAVVVATLLNSAPLSTDRERIRAAGIPPRTYEVARTRVLENGWLLERYVPDPQLCGCTHAALVFGRPYAESWTQCSDALSTIPGNVVHWEFEGSLFSLAFVDGQHIGEFHPARRIRDRFARLIVLEAALSSPCLPAYFDFGAAWARAIGWQGRVTYPTPIPHGVTTRGRPNVDIQRQAVALAAAPFRDRSRSAEDMLPLQAYAKSGKLREQLAPFLARRYFPDLSRLPGFGPWNIENIVFVSGELISGHPASGPLQSLRFACGVAPFLYVTDERHVFFAGLAPAPRASPPILRSSTVTKELQRDLTKIEYFREPVRGSRLVTQHQYDQILG